MPESVQDGVSESLNHKLVCLVSPSDAQPWHVVEQVTNPAVDPLREAIVMSLKTMIGPEMDISELGSPKQAHRLTLETPVLTVPQMEALKKTNHRWGQRPLHHPSTGLIYRQ